MIRPSESASGWGRTSELVLSWTLGELYWYFGPNSDALTLSASGCETKAHRTSYGCRVERYKTRGFQNFDGVNCTEIGHTNSQERLAFDVLIPHVEWILDRDFVKECRGLLNIGISSTTDRPNDD